MEGDEQEDSLMADEASVTSEEFWRNNNKALLIEDEEGYEEDLRLMESLFERPEKRY